MFLKALPFRASAFCRRWLAVSLLVAVLGWMTPQATHAQECSSPGSGIPSSIDFTVDGAGNPLSAGDVIDSNTFSGIDISVVSSGTPGLPLVIFDTQNPTGGDTDLGTPNEAFGGPGVGAAGGPGQAGENPVGLGNALIINEDFDFNDPDDWGSGGTIIFIFDEAVEVRQIQTLDADNASPGEVRVYSDAAGTNQVDPTVLGQALGENSFQGWMTPQATHAQECSSPGSGIPSSIDFTVDGAGNPLSAGDVIDSNTFSGIDISVVSSGTPGLPLVIFDTQNPTGGDTDLGTPNEAFGGPGVGAAGGPGQAGENPVGLGNALIINEDFDFNDPDDWGSGGTIIFIFDEAVEVRQIQTLDADNASPGEVRVYSDAAGTNQVGPTVLGQALGENSFQIITIGQLGIRRLEFILNGSGTVDKLVLCGTDDGTATFGDTIYHDADESGTQEIGEVGLPGVKVWLRNNLGVAIDSMLTDGLGKYSFTALVAAIYTADVDESTLPAGVYLTTGNEPDTYVLSAGENYVDGDFGYNGGVLPVELTSFDVRLDGRDALLTWETASETNNAGFEIQLLSKNDGASSRWQALDFVEGRGTTELAQSYGYRVEELEPGRHVFRLKQIDFDGTFEYHPEVEVVVEMVERLRRKTCRPGSNYFQKMMGPHRSGKPLILSRGGAPQSWPNPMAIVLRSWSPDATSSASNRSTSTARSSITPKSRSSSRWSSVSWSSRPIPTRSIHRRRCALPSIGSRWCRSRSMMRWAGRLRCCTTG